MSCPDEERLLAFVQRRLPEAELAAVEEHVADCDDCGRVVAEAARDLTASAAAPEPPDAPLREAARLGRYVILERIGRGAMGEVYSAYDPQLDRRVALKLLRPDRSEDRKLLTERLLREGQSMARLAHPNVVAVFDAGALDDGGVFLAMELIEGETLNAWLARERHGWREVVAAFVQAGRGLSAAHRAGVVHRDFKPDNVLIGADGRVRVTDFGLARRGAEAEAPPDDAPLELTMTGTLVGTPVFMAPEQFRGEPAAQPADIFAFCSALYQALFRQRPFAGERLAELRDSVLAGAVREPPASAGVPVHVRRAVLRGLRADPTARFAGMDELLAALSADPARRIRRALLVAAPVLVLGGALLAWGSLAHREEAPCRGGAARLGAIWNPAKKEKLAEAFAASAAPYAAATTATVTRILDGYGAAWVEGYADACEATHVRGEQSPALLDRRMECLDDRLRELNATASALSVPERSVVDRSVSAAYALRPVAACADRQRLGERVAPAEGAVRQRVDRARAVLAHARAFKEAGRFALGIPEAAWASAEARAIGYAPLEGEALFELGMLQRGAGLIKQAEEPLVGAVLAAARAGDDVQGIRAETELATLLGFNVKTDEAVRWASLAEEQTHAIGNDPVLRAGAIGARAYALVTANRAPEAFPAMNEAIELLEGKLGRAHPLVAQAMMRLGLGYTTAGRHVEAAEWEQRALDVDREMLGAEHPVTVNVMFNLTGMLYGQGRYREAMELAAKTTELKAKLLGPRHREVALCLNNLGQAQTSLGRYEDAVASLQSSIAMYEESLGPEHAAVINPLALIGLALVPLGRAEEAIASERRALALTEKKFGKENAMVAFVAVALADVLEAAERNDEACATFDRAVATLEKADPEHSDLASMLAGQARCLRRAGRLAESERLLGRALALGEKGLGPSHPDVARILMDLGETRLAGEDRAGARAAFERAVGIVGNLDVAPLVVAEARLGLAQALRATGGAVSPELTRAREEILASPYASAELKRMARR